MICIISDTHDNVPVVAALVPRLKSLQPTLVLHCGDITAAPMLDYFAGLPLRFVFGNCDADRMDLQRRADKLGFGKVGDELEMEIDGKNIYVAHGNRGTRLEQAIDSQIYDYVFHGHTHRRRDEKIGRTRVVNPGALYQASILSFATLDITADMLTFFDVEDPHAR